MKYIVTRSCGHEEEVEMYGPGSERKRSIARMEAEECPVCRAKRAAERDRAMGLSPLDGSPRMSAWASSLRLGLFERLGGLARGMIRRVAEAEADPAISDAEVADAVAEGDRNLLAMYEGLAHETSSAWIIDHRSSLDAMALRYL